MENVKHSRLLDTILPLFNEELPSEKCVGLFHFIQLKAAVFLTILFTSCYFASFTQNFNYSFSSGTGTYTNLSGAVVITSDSWANNTYRIPIGFNFNFLGKSFDSLTVNPDRGFLVFDKNGNYALTAFKGVTTKESGTSVSYKLESGILKIEFKNCQYPLGDSSGELNFQVWLYQQGGKIEIKTGNNTYSGTENEFIKPLIGLINLNQNTTTRAVMINGNPAQPEKQQVNGEEEFPVLDAVPATGSIYTFTPRE